jgi:hypothetical protein
MHTGTKKKCTAKLVTNNRSVACPAYSGVWDFYTMQKQKPIKFFCPDDIERCVKGFRRKWVIPFSDTQGKFPIPPVWPVMLGTKLTCPEIVALENAGFQLPSKERVTPTRFFKNSAPPLDLSRVGIPENPNYIPSRRKSKATRYSGTGPSTKRRENVGSARAMHGTILKLTMIPHPGFNCVMMLQSKPPPTDAVYQVTVSSHPECTCAAFKDMIIKFGSRRNSCLNCKHFYYIFVKVSNLDPKVNMFIHAPTFSFNKVKLILEGGLLTHSTT